MLFRFKMLWRFLSLLLYGWAAFEVHFPSLSGGGDVEIGGHSNGETFDLIKTMSKDLDRV